MTYSFPHIPERIQWHEGMLLAPQHFQQTQARTDALLSWQVLAASPMAWGVRHLDIDTGLLANGLLRVEALEALMDDGTAVWHDASCAGHGLLELDLSVHAEQLETKVLDIWLTLPRARVMANAGAPSRFSSLMQAPEEDEVSQAVPADIPRLRPQLALAAGAMPSSLWQSLRLGSVFKDNKQIRLTSDLPPLMRLPRTHPLWVRSWQLATELRAKAGFVARQMQVPSSRAEDRLTALEQRERLSSLLQGLATLEGVLQTLPLHPYNLYLTLCGLSGPLALLRPGAVSPMPPAYEQSRPGAALEPLLTQLEDALTEVSQDHLLHLFEFQEDRYTLKLQPAWTTPRLVVGLRGKPEKDLLTWMEGAVIGALSSWPSLRERRILGAARQHIDAAPELGVRTSSGYTLFAIETPAPLLESTGELVLQNNENYAALRPQEMVLFVKGHEA